MKDLVETPDGDHYSVCGTMTSRDESNQILSLRKCSDCGEIRVNATGLTEVILLFLTVGTASAVLDATITVGKGTTAVAYPGIGPVLAGITILTGMYIYFKLTQRSHSP